ncbi:MAG: leucine--tRNA ligase, partial [Bacilli bacterium]
AGHPVGYTATDIISRMKRMQGYNVLHPMGFDSFGLPAEQYAISTGNHPALFTEKNILIFTEQLKMIGFSYDWNRNISTSDPKFYKWTQWIFKQLYLSGLVKNVNMPVNWCEQLGTVLANDEIIDGKSERGGYPVVRKNMQQWTIDMPKYAERLLNGLDEINWPESTKEMQKNWIGKSVGALVDFSINESNLNFQVFTTRCDTLFGATYCVLAPEHELVLKIVTSDKLKQVKEYIKVCSAKSELERTELNKEKTGVFTGSYAINPVSKQKIPIFIADYVLATYATGAIMAVPAHDERDYEFALKFNLDIIPVITQETSIKDELPATVYKNIIKQGPYIGDGIHINSQFLNGMNKEEAIMTMINWLEQNKCGKKKINYRLREWIFARQRYWGEPIPIIHFSDEKDQLLDDKELPLVLPELSDYRPSKDGSSPLKKALKWVNITKNGKNGQRETATMPGNAGSSWYFLRYIDPDNDKELANQELLKHWMPVDLYIGGPEHAVGHLLYARMWNNYLYDLGIVPVREPFKKLVHQGMILGSNGVKMGKRFPEYIVNPNDITKAYGADTLRLYEMFMGPLEADKPWNESGVLASKKFLDRIFKIYEEKEICETANINLEKIYHQTVKKVTNDYETLNFNTAISQMMIFVNAINKETIFPKNYAEGLLKLLNPLVPHMTEEIWEKLGHKKTISYEQWPIYQEEKTITETYEMVVQINGKVRGKTIISNETTKEEMINLALAIDNIKNHLTNQKISKIITIPQKLVNIVIEK